MKLRYIAALVMCAFISAGLIVSYGSQQYVSEWPVAPVTPVKNVIYGADIGPVAVVCIDGIQYLATATALTPRYTIDAEGDPYVSTCLNR